jgi:hypothetical protein
MSDQNEDFAGQALKDSLSFNISKEDIAVKEDYIREFVTLNYYTARDGDLKAKRAFHFSVMLISRMLFNADINIPDNLDGLDLFTMQKSITKQLTSEEKEIYELYLCLNNAKYHICQYQSLFDTVKSFNGLERYLNDIFNNYYTDLPYVEKKNLLSSVIVTFIAEPKDLIKLLQAASKETYKSYDYLLTKFIDEYNEYMNSRYT